MIATGSALLVSLITPAVPAQATATADGGVTPPPGTFRIAFAATGARNCNEITPRAIKITVERDNSAFTISFKDYRAMIGGPSSARRFELDSSCVLLANRPAGYTFSIGEIDYHGNARLAGGVNAELSGGHSLVDTWPARPWKTTLAGPANGTWSVTQPADQSASFIPCDDYRMIHVNSGLLLTASDTADLSAPSQMTLGSSDPSAPTAGVTYHLRWRACPASGTE